MNKFWTWTKAVTGVPEIVIDGVIAPESWFGDEVTPKVFREELLKYGKGDDISIRINSPGGDPFASADIYVAISEYSGHTRGKITGLAASGAAYLAMACDELFIADVGNMMIHKASVYGGGNEDRLTNLIAMLRNIDTAMVTAFCKKTDKTEEEVRGYLNQGDFWMSAQEAVDRGFADGILDYRDEYKAAVKFAARMTTCQLASIAATDDETEERRRILQENEGGTV